ncbi:mitochondrial sodium/calcium exchanger protein-like [Oscarella lobularis]|uniref:mitochondrial sodium/calcium exchanger protein-like n=1 Tax=Oscarella lobularis TaxID=121494 RepID=UPI0033140AB5
MKTLTPLASLLVISAFLCTAGASEILLTSTDNVSTSACEHLKAKVRANGSQFNTTCHLVLANCTDVPQLANYLAFVTCDLNNLQWLAYIILIFWLLLLMSLLATTADYFFVPPLNLLATKLKLSPSVAGITLLAIGNGAPDVFTAYSALTKASDFPLELSALLGASIFILSIVLGSVILVSEVSKKTIKPMDFYRDIVAYIVVVVTVVVICIDQKIYIYESVVFLGIYFLYIGVVVALSYREQRKEKHRSPSLLSKSRSSTLDSSSVNVSTEAEDEDNLALDGLSWPAEKGVHVKFQYIVEFPFSILRWLTVPPCNEVWDTRRWIFAVLSPAPAGLLILLASKGWDGFVLTVGKDFPLYALILIIGFACSIGILISWQWMRRRSPVGEAFTPHVLLQFLLGLLAFITSIAWMNILAGEVVAVLQSFGVLFNVSLAILGVTVLAIGNSVGDWVADTAVARAGKPSMGISSCFGSPLLNDVLGLGISLTVYTARHYPTPFSFDKHSKSFQTVVFCWITLGCVLLMSLIVFPLTKFAPPRSFSFSLIFVYIVFTVLNVLDVSDVISMNFHF